MRSPCTFPVKAIETPPALMAPNVIWLPLAAPSTLPWEKQPLWTVIVPFSCWPFTVKAIWNPPEAGIELLLHVPFHVPASPPPADVLSLGLEDAGVGEGVGEASGDGDGLGLAEAALDAAFPLRLAAGDVAAAAGDFEPPAFTRANAPPAAATAMVPMTAIRSGILARPGARATRPRVRPPPEPGPPGAVPPGRCRRRPGRAAFSAGYVSGTRVDERHRGGGSPGSEGLRDQQHDHGRHHGQFVGPGEGDPAVAERRRQLGRDLAASLRVLEGRLEPLAPRD